MAKGKEIKRRTAGSRKASGAALSQAQEPQTARTHDLAISREAEQIRKKEAEKAAAAELRAMQAQEYKELTRQFEAASSLARKPPVSSPTLSNDRVTDTGDLVRTEVMRAQVQSLMLSGALSAPPSYIADLKKQKQTIVSKALNEGVQKTSAAARDEMLSHEPALSTESSTGEGAYFMVTVSGEKPIMVPEKEVWNYVGEKGFRAVRVQSKTPSSQPQGPDVN